jgi:hypothetical protein
MLFHKINRNKFATVGRKLDTVTFKLVTEFFEAQFTTNKNDGTLKHMGLEHIKKHAQLKLKNKLCDKICTREDKRCTYQVRRQIASRGTRPCLTMIARSNVGTSIAIVIATTTTNAEHQSALVLSAPAIATGRMTGTTISLKS